jgi:hypothetical protein
MEAYPETCDVRYGDRAQTCYSNFPHGYMLHKESARLKYRQRTACYAFCSEDRLRLMFRASLVMVFAGRGAAAQFSEPVP